MVSKCLSLGGKRDLESGRDQGEATELSPLSVLQDLALERARGACGLRYKHVSERPAISC